MRIPGLKTLKQTALWIKSRFTEHGLILGYHRITDEPFDPYQVCIKREFFVEQLELLRKYFNPIRLDQLIRGVKERNLPRRAVAITFDDGYAENLHVVKPLLEEFGIPATVFITTGYMGGSFWWDEIAGLVCSMENLNQGFELSINGRSRESNSSNSNGIRSKEKKFESREQLLQFLYFNLRDLPYWDRQGNLLRLSSSIRSIPTIRQIPKVLSPGEVVELARGGLIEVGAHTVTHPMLAWLSEEDQRDEIQQSKALLEGLLGVSVKGFSYPNGSSSALARSLVQDYGYRYACASNNGVVWSKSDPFHLPRFWAPNCDGTSFSRWLSRWLDN